MTAGSKYTIDWAKGIIDWHLHEELEETTFLAVGDILAEGEKEEIINTKGGTFLFRPTQSIFQSADILLGNLENPLSERGAPIFKIGPCFRGATNLAKVLSDAGFTILGVANNHARDYGDCAFLDTLDCLQRAGIMSVGGGRDNSSAAEPVIIRTRNLSIGVFAFTFRQESVAQRKRPGAADLDNPDCYEAVKVLCDNVDLVIVSLHMDPEYTNYPAPHRMKMARSFVDVGAEMVIGHHPHVPQGLEIYRGKLIAYSLGNFIFHPEKHKPLTRLGYLLKAKLTKEGTAWAEIIPYKINDYYQPIPLSGKAYIGAMSHLKNISKALHDPEVVNLNWEEIASKETLAIVKHILRAILVGKKPPLWSCHLTLLKHRYEAFVKSLLRGKVSGYLRDWIQSK